MAEVTAPRFMELADFAASIVHQVMRAEALQQVAAGAPGNVHAFFLEEAAAPNQIYVHAKLMIVDDRYVTVGSANLNFRSHTTDTELQLGVVDLDLAESYIGGQPAQVGRAVQGLRAQLWAEHLNEDPALVADPILGLGTFPTGGAKRGHLVSLPAPPVVPAIDWRETARSVLRSIQEVEAWRTLAPILLSPLGPLASGIAGHVDLGVIADLVPDPERFIRDFMKPKTVC